MQVDYKRLIIIFVILLIGLGVSYAGSQHGALYQGMPIALICGVWAFVLNGLAFIPSSLNKTEKYYDLIGSLTYLSVVALALCLSPQISSLALLAALMVSVWAVRLGLFLFIRINQDGHDDRFDEIKVDPLRFFIVWMIQALWAILSIACALAIITSTSHSPIGIITYIGIAIWLFGFTIEVIADAQKRAFKRLPENNGQFIRTGLWSWSQHPNYFGEITLWLGMAIMALPILQGAQWLTLISPLFVIFLLTKVSGIPTLAKKSKKRWGNDAEFKAYQKNTSLLIPMPPKSK